MESTCLVDNKTVRLHRDTPALILAPMDSVTDSPMRALQGEFGAFTFAVSEFVRVNDHPVPSKVFLRDVPELLNDGKTVSGLPVQVQLLGGDPQVMAESALNAISVGAHSIDLNFGCPAPTVNRNDGGASILRSPCRIREIVGAVRRAVPSSIPVSAKVRLGWNSTDEIHKISEMVISGGADWLTIHARTKAQRYQPPVDWGLIGKIRAESPIPVVANGDIWNLDDFRKCRETTGCCHFMLGRGALSNPALAGCVAKELDIAYPPTLRSLEWPELISRLAHHCGSQSEKRREKTLHRLKQWLNFAARFGGFSGFEETKRAQTEMELLRILKEMGRS